MSSIFLKDIKYRRYLFVLTMFILSMFSGCDAPQENATRPAELLPGSSRLSDLLSDKGIEGYARATQARNFSFPEDHGPHADFRNEWWYVTGNLDADSGERFGFELTFFRFSLTPENNSSIASSWQTNQVYVAHFAITDVEANQFHFSQRYSRGSAGLAGARAAPFRVWLDDWAIHAAVSTDLWSLRADGDGFGIDLNLVPLKLPVLNGEQGLSQKSAEPGNASYYYSIPRLQSNGTLRIAERTYAVSGLSWIDREWSSSALSRQQLGWDWFALQLSDGSDLMFYQIRRNDGSIDMHSAGTWVDSTGKAIHLRQGDVSISVRQYWQSERRDRYPAAWDIEIASLGVSLEVVPAMADQELLTNVRYWEGAVDVSGISAGQAISGRGYVELTGYARTTAE
jgi:predicted secreted hydrolase